MIDITTITPRAGWGAAIDDARAHARACYPHESVGAIVGTAYEPFDNAAAAPGTRFVVAPEQALSVGPIDALIHSHIGAAANPSGADIRAQQAMGVPWGIIAMPDRETPAPPRWFGDHLLDQPLIGRGFVFGAADCFGLVRAWFWQKREIRLPDVPRDDGFDKRGEDLFSPWSFQLSGVPVGRDAMHEGDVVVMAIRADVPNHCGVVERDGLFLHHLRDELSRRDALARWMQHVVAVYRYMPS